MFYAAKFCGNVLMQQEKAPDFRSGSGVLPPKNLKRGWGLWNGAAGGSWKDFEESSSESLKSS